MAASPVPRQPPRVTWHRGINRYIYAMADGDRTIKLSVSTNATGTSWATPVALNTVAPIYGSFDLTCPTHQTSVSQCQIIFHHSTSSSLDRAGRLKSCRFAISAVGAITDVVCMNSTALETRAAASLNDLVTDSGQAAYLFSGSTAFAGLNANVRMATTSTNPVFSVVGAYSDIFTPFTSSYGSQSPWGGTSCDYVEWSGDVICSELRGGSRW